jgi:iron complex transport system substrate-binding protein
MRFCFVVPVIMFLLGGCTQSPPTNTSASPTSAPKVLSPTPRDDLGREIKLDKVPQRVVVIGPGAVEILFAIGAGDTLVGRDPYADYPSQAQKAAVVADYRGPMFEQTVAARPDFIIVQGETWDKDRIDLWQQKCGAPVAALTATNIKQVAASIEKIGAWMGKMTEAKRVAQPLYDAANATTVPLKAQPTAIFEVQRSPLWAAGQGTLIHDVMRLAGVRNIAEIEGYKQLNLESLTAKQPQLYIVSTSGEYSLSQPHSQSPSYDKAIAEREKVRRAPKVGQLAPVRAGKIIVIPSNWVLRPGPRLVQGIRELKAQAQKLTGAVSD